MALDSFFSALSHDTLLTVLSAKHKINQLVKNKDYNFDLVKEQELIVCLAIDRLASHFEFSPFLILQIYRLKDIAIQGFTKIGDEINESKLLELCVRLEELFQMILNVTVV